MAIPTRRTMSESLFEMLGPRRSKELKEAIERAVCEALGIQDDNPLHEAREAGVRAQDVADAMSISRARLYQLLEEGPAGVERVRGAVKALLDKRGAKSAKRASPADAYVELLKHPASGADN